MTPPLPISDEGRPFTEEEIVKLRSILDKEERTIWLWATLRVWVGWVAGIVGAYFAVKSFFVDVISGIPK